MKLQFDAHQEYQLEAIRATVALFTGQPDASQTGFTQDDELASLKLTETGVANHRVITDEQWLANLQAVQKTHGIAPSPTLEGMTLDDGTSVTAAAGAFPNFTVEMETGTGKTYVYLRTIFELSKTWGFKKFVVVVPSVAIREGVVKSLQITKEHFQTLYDYERVEFMVYDSAKVNQLRNFALSDAIQILVINIDAFAKDSAEPSGAGDGAMPKKKSKGNVINQVRETGLKPIEFIQAAHPIVILDEPQNLETDIRKLAISRLGPMCTLRYSATHRNTYNLIYSLNPVRAYELGLVKQIGVDSVIELKDANQAYVELASFKTGARSVSAKLSIWVNQKGGPAKKSITVKNGDDLFGEKFSNSRETYRDGFIVNEIDAGEGFITFANDVRVRLGSPHGALTDAILRLQIEATIRRHFEKAWRLHPLGIKVLSVFFIDRVANYREYLDDGTTGLGKFALWFEEIYEQYRAMDGFSGLMQFDAARVHNGYFSQDKRAVSPFETVTGKTNADAEASAFELIMRDKERLLDLAEPLAFVFSHSALREGWDNPNVFQICTLAESSSDIKKRQEIGRGLRLCVNKNGERVRDPAINRLTVVANESYEDFAAQLQTEMIEAGVKFKREMVQNERDKVNLRLRKGYETDTRFLELWDKIRARTRYHVDYKTSELISKAASRIKAKMSAIGRPKVVLTRADIAISVGGVTGTQTGYKTQTVEAKYVMPDFVAQVQAKTGLAKSTVAQILLESTRLADAVNNPQAFVDDAAELINAVKREFLVYGDGSDKSGVKYVKLDEAFYEMRRFESDDLMEVFASNVQEVKKQEKTLFSHIVIDSNSGPERLFAQACEDNDDVLFYIKLPKWFKIDTPVGTYNPDWALAYKNDQLLYFVAETKNTGGGHVDMGLLRPIEDLRIECGRRHFKNFEEVRFKVVSSLTELVD
ncbi:MAG: restriction endonuclease [Polaromonas sp. 39-63-203]|jgi:type III restriction enzyme|uniref:restriction endonuclease n=1 Tax=Polaromonas sp. TaxID=1869339 RepID=UPI000BCAB6CE|nr:DEAD/DEAH box helicase family protein [Polaromonas sp.]OYY53258.1 MAG: restriction endonuclease [Polaromonas sp. 35-63-240]OYY99749.1 MAG: restriction endonuclease [Polaromonas sp. 28-63-22]OYZ84111.1 MAG: restriction endonuclease [Polaromonas sp. 24-62-144]OZA98817.1 MAG: restriction endonuclease [Polaromonas sp. 39-63-203]HQS30329.1 DEAD/DEAH box helicase family protein [Polaromonas sp.]